ncbi:carbohydrate ABC transporter permease [Sinomonas sp. G460-2]|uniref:carbohydrate ABC transporter permease n=1 Tax=Sinomonas sp. G460-2 TaxID=3393464 RepID=UPI0039F060D6
MAGKLSKGAILAVYAVLILVPLLVVLFGTFKTTPELFASPFAPPNRLDLGNYGEVLGGQNLGTAFLNSTIVTACSVTLTLFIATLAAYGISRIPGWKGWLIFGFIVLGMSVPAQANMIPQYVLFQQLGLLDSQVGLVLINIVVTLPVAVFILGGFMRTLPSDLFEAAKVDGSGPWRTYYAVAVPLSLPSIAATGIFLFVMHWNDLLYPLLFISSPEKRTLPVALLSFQGEFLTNYPLLFAGVVLASIPIVVAYVFLQRFFVAGMTAGAVKG